MERARKLARTVRWAGLVPGGTRLPGRVVVLSPHLDDAVLSLGASIAWATRHGASVTVVTVLAGDPDSKLPAGEWDERSGFITAGAAARARREEDRLACGAVGAVPAWLPFSDMQYPRGGDDRAIVAALEPLVADADAVLVPGHPLVQPDHRWLLELVLATPPAGGLGIYLEQPYALQSPERVPPSAPLAGAGPWLVPRATLGDRRAKRRACRAYVSQLRWLDPVRRLERYEAGRGGESIAWLEGETAS